MALTATEVIEQAIARWLNCHGIDVLDALERAGYHIAKPGQARQSRPTACCAIWSPCSTANGSTASCPWMVRHDLVT